MRSLTLRECIERALADNLEIRAERINPNIATWGVVFQQGVFDPGVGAAFNYEDSSVPQSSGSSSITRQFQPQLSLSGKLPTGTAYGLTVSEARTGGSSYADYLYAGSTTVSISQPLLKNFWFDPNLASIRVARKQRDIAVQSFVQLVMNTISGVSQAYYELVFAIEDHKAKREDLARASQLLEENRKRVKVGVMSPLDVTQAEAGVAEREEAVIVSERVIKDNENVLKRLISSDVQRFRSDTLVPVDYPLVEMVETDVARSTRTALESRPDLLAAKHEIERRNILVQYNHNQLWPELDLRGSYGMNGISRSGFDALTRRQLANDNPVWGVGITITFPLGNRQARANYNIARLDREQSLITLKQVEQNIIVQVDNAVGRMQTNLKRVDATRAASRLAEESLKAEETKMRTGTSTSFLVLQAQSQLASARSAEIRARSDYSESLVELYRVEGTVLHHNNIVLDEKY
jgi:outer membrane protein TolC